MRINLSQLLPQSTMRIVPLLACAFIYAEASATIPADPNTFLTLLERYVAEDGVSATAYYDTVDPDGKSKTYAGWLTEAGFIDSPADYRSSGFFPENSYASVTYQNIADLGFIRRVRARCSPSCDAPNPDIHAIIENYPTFEDAANRTNRLASVTMDWSAAADGSNPSKKFVSFYAYTGTIDPARFVPDIRDDVMLGTPFAPDLDGRGGKAIPGLCNSCHGGAPNELNGDGTYADNGNTGGLFIPSDLNNYAYDPDRPELSRAAQQAEFKKMNEVSLITHRGKKKFDEEAEISRHPPVQELIEGWYGGASLPNAIFNGDFVPAGWLPPAAPADAEELYLESIAPACRACHVQQKRELDFATYEGFMVFEDAHKELVLRVECGLDDDSADRGDGEDNQAVMPLALVTFNKFWEEGEADVFKEHLGAIDCAEYD